MIEHRTHPLSRELMLAELTEICAKLVAAGVERAAVSFGWDSNLDIDDMWVDVEVSLMALPEYLANAESAGTIEVGKAADVVVWNGDPFSTYTRPERVWVDGALLYDANNPRLRPVSDFELGQPGEGDVK